MVGELEADDRVIGMRPAPVVVVSQPGLDERLDIVLETGARAAQHPSEQLTVVTATPGEQVFNCTLTPLKVQNAAENTANRPETEPPEPAS